MAVNLTAGLYGNGTLPPILAGLQCGTGREGSFSNCSLINGEVCTPSLAAAVSCEPLIGGLINTCLLLLLIFCNSLIKYNC